MAIIRGSLSPDNYTIVPNEWLRDQRLSYKAKGILAYIMSHRADYELTVEQMVEQSSDGANAIYSGLKELVGVGYLIREQRRNPNGTMGAIDYRVADEVTASRKSACGKPRSGDDQGKNDEPAGQTASRFSACGKTASGKSKTKKEHSLEEQGLEEQEKTPTPSPAPSAPPGAADERGEERVSASQEEPPVDAVEGLVREVVALRPDWSPRDVRRVATDPEVADRGNPELVRAAFLIAAHDRGTKVPGRLLHAACPHWERAARELGLLAHDDPGAGGPAPEPPRCPDGLCDGSGRFLQVVERQEVRGYKDGKPIFGTVEDEVPTTCTACYPGYRQLAGTHQGV